MKTRNKCKPIWGSKLIKSQPLVQIIHTQRLRLRLIRSPENVCQFVSKEIDRPREAHNRTRNGESGELFRKPFSVRDRFPETNGRSAGRSAKCAIAAPRSIVKT